MNTKSFLSYILNFVGFWTVQNNIIRRPCLSVILKIELKRLINIFAWDIVFLFLSFLLRTKFSTTVNLVFRRKKVFIN